MKISIITSTFNSENVLQDCLASLVTQDYEDVEHIFVDGASSDSTVLILRSKLGKKNKLISEPDSGIYDALNKGIFIANGSIIGVLHSDDIYSNTFVLSLVAENFIKNPDLDMVIGNVEFFDGTLPIKILRIYRSEFFRSWMFRFGFMPAHTATFVKKEIYEKFGNYKTDFESAADFEFFLRTIGTGKVRYKFLNTTLVKMKVGGKSTSGFKSYVRTSAEILKALKMHKIYSNMLFIYVRLPIKFIFKCTYLISRFLKKS